jgi:hypothetical protein
MAGRRALEGVSMLVVPSRPGPVVPLRSLWRRVSSGRHANVVRRAIGDGACCGLVIRLSTEAFGVCSNVEALKTSWPTGGLLDDVVGGQRHVEDAVFEFSPRTAPVVTVNLGRATPTAHETEQLERAFAVVGEVE